MEQLNWNVNFNSPKISINPSLVSFYAVPSGESRVELVREISSSPDTVDKNHLERRKSSHLPPIAGTTIVGTNLALERSDPQTPNPPPPPKKAPHRHNHTCECDWCRRKKAAFRILWERQDTLRLSRTRALVFRGRKSPKEYPVPGESSTNQSDGIERLAPSTNHEVHSNSCLGTGQEAVRSKDESDTVPRLDSYPVLPTQNPLPEEEPPKPFVEPLSVGLPTSSESDGPARRTRSRVKAAESRDVQTIIGSNDGIEVDPENHTLHGVIESPKLISQTSAEATAQNDEVPEGSAAPTSPDDTKFNSKSPALYANCLYRLICRQVVNNGQANGSGSANDAPRNSKSSSSSNPKHRPASKGKRRADQISRKVDNGSQGGDGQDDDDDDDDGTDPRPAKSARKQEPEARGLACPFFKRYPDKFRRCVMFNLKDSSRVKQHINRIHSPPIYCPLCSTVFKSECVHDSHIRESICAIQPQKERTWATSEQLEQLGSHKRSGSSTETEKWNKIYGILFPGEGIPDSPYLDSTLSAQGNFMRQAVLNAAPAAMLVAIQDAIPDVLRDTHAEELQSIILKALVEVFDLITRIPSNQSDPQTQSEEPSQEPAQEPLQEPTQGTGVSDSGVGRSVTAAHDKPKEGSPPAAQEDGQEQPSAADFNNEGVFPDLSAFDVHIEQMPGFWDVGRFNEYLLAEMLRLGALEN